MSDYSKWKVTELKAELKNRGVPQTGLRLKQDFIDKLIALDSEPSEQPTEPTAVKEENQIEQNNDADQKTDEPAPPSQQSGTESLPTEGAPSPQKLSAQLDRPSDDPQPVAIESKDAGSEATQPTQQTTTDHRAIGSEEAVPAPAADSQELESNKLKSPAQLEEPAAEDRIDSEPPTDGGDDLRKRKRRSQSPPPTIEVVKKSRIDNEKPRVILKEDVQPGITIGPNNTTRRDPRWRSLVPTTKPPKSVQSSEQASQDDDHQVEPALHPTTSSIYIRDLMRPLQAIKLEKSSTRTCYNRPVKSPAMKRCVSTASRVRSKLHGAVWPNERDRKPLWVDFIPDQKFSEWVRTEQDSAPGRGTQRWEVFYKKTDDGVQAILQDVRNGARSGHQPTGPARRHSPDAESRRESQPSRAPPAQQQSTGKGFQALDDRFKSTKTKPKLYYLPVSRDIVDKRLAQFDTLIRKDPRHYGQEDENMGRITFEDIDVFVDGGPEFPGPRTRGGSGGGRRGGRGSWRGRRR